MIAQYMDQVVAETGQHTRLARRVESRGSSRRRRRRFQSWFLAYIYEGETMKEVQLVFISAVKAV